MAEISHLLQFTISDQNTISGDHRLQKLAVYAIHDHSFKEQNTISQDCELLCCVIHDQDLKEQFTLLTWTGRLILFCENFTIPRKNFTNLFITVLVKDHNPVANYRDEEQLIQQLHVHYTPSTPDPKHTIT